VRVLRLIFALFLARRARGRERPPPPPDPSKREVRHSPGAELIVAALLVATGVAGVAFVVVYLISANTQLLGLALGAGLAFAAIACVVLAKRVLPEETIVEERPELAPEPEREQAEDHLLGGGEGITRRGALVAAGSVAGAGLAAAVALPLASIGPAVHDEVARTPWRRGRHLVSDSGARINLDHLPVGSFTTAFPEGADKEELGSPLIVARLRPDELDPPKGRVGWDAEGAVAFSKICTHAGCAVAMFRYPLNEDTSHPPALVCPCHYSTFDPRKSAEVAFGPAARPLPQIPLMVDTERNLVAGGGYSGQIGPPWSGVRQRS
jgi:ubiquinol-cytochrome c reductase iron-sulfur subunit